MAFEARTKSLFHWRWPAIGWRFRLAAGLLACATAAHATGVGGQQPAAGDPITIRLQGSTTFNTRIIEPFRSRIEQMAGVRLVVIPSKSIWGLVSLIEQRADVAMISSSLASELESLHRVVGPQAGADLTEISIARSRVAFAVHPSNPLRKLAADKMRGILLGDIRNWKEVGGPDLPIRVVATQDGGGTVAAVRAALLDDRPITAPAAIRLESAKHVVQVVSQEPGAIAIAQLTLTQEQRLPEVELPEPVEQLLCLVVRGEPTAEITAFVNAARTIAAEVGL